MENFVGSHPIADGIRERRQIISATGRGRVAFVDPDDIATVAGTLLMGDPIPDGDLILTGPEALSYDEVAAVITEVGGKPVRHTSVTVEELITAISASGVPVEYARVLAEMDDRISAGSEDRTTTTVQDITGRAPRGFDDFLDAVYRDRSGPLANAGVV